MVCFVVTQHSETELSLCLRYSKTSCEATPKYPFKFRLNSDDPMIDFLRSNISYKISSKISSRRLPKMIPSKFRLNSDDPCPPCVPWINFFVTFWCYIQKNVYLCTLQGKWWPEGHSEKPLKKGFIWCQSITIWHHHRSRWSPTTPSNRKRKWRRIALSLFFYRRRKPPLWQPPFSKGQPRYWDWYHIGSRNRRTILLIPRITQIMV